MLLMDPHFGGMRTLGFLGGVIQVCKTCWDWNLGHHVEVVSISQRLSAVSYCLSSPYQLLSDLTWFQTVFDGVGCSKELGLETEIQEVSFIKRDSNKAYGECFTLTTIYNTCSTTILWQENFGYSIINMPSKYPS